MAPKRDTPMTTDQIESAVHGMVADAITYLETELSPVRAKATEYYRGDPFRNEEDGRSQFVSTDVRDTVLSLLPSLVRLFLPTSGHIIRYDARPKSEQTVQQAVAMAAQATDYVNEIVLQQDNNGFSELYAAFKDALIRKVGFIKYLWEDRSSYKAYTARNCYTIQYEALVNDPDIEITKETKSLDRNQLPTWDLEYKQWRRGGVARLLCTPPEEVLISRDARTRDDAIFMAHRTEKTKSELMAMGVPESDIDDFGGRSSEVRQSIEEITRRGGIAQTDTAPQPQLRRHLWIEAYPYLDIDGDGEAELVKIRCIGPGCHVVGEPEPIDERPFALFCPDPEPHVVFGQCVYDRVADLQLMKSSVIRAFADGTADAIFPRTFYMEGSVDRQAMETTAIGQNIPVRDGLQPAQAVLEMRHEFDGSAAMQLVQYLDAVKQQRIGPLPATLDPDALQSTPQLGVKAVVQAAGEQVELIARVFAATGMQQLARGLLHLLIENQPRAQIVRLRDQYVSVDPRAWDAEMDVSINVALGTQEKLGVLAANMQQQAQVLQLLGPTNPAVTVGQYVHSLRTMLQMAGIPDVGAYWNDVPLNWQPPPAPQSPDPNLLLAQAEMTKGQAALAKQQADFQIAQVSAAQEMADLKAQLTSKAAELDLQRQEMLMTDARERDKIEANIALAVFQTNAQFKTQETVSQIDADIQREKMTQDLVLGTWAKPGNGNKTSTPAPIPSTPSPKPKKKGPKVTTVEHDPQGRIAKLTTQEPD